MQVGAAADYELVILWVNRDAVVVTELALCGEVRAAHFLPTFAPVGSLVNAQNVVIICVVGDEGVEDIGISGRNGEADSSTILAAGQAFAEPHPGLAKVIRPPDSIQCAAWFNGGVDSVFHHRMKDD